MKFTGKNLLLIRRSIDLAICDLHNQIVTCPDVNEHADAIKAIGLAKARYANLSARIDAVLAKERGKR